MYKRDDDDDDVIKFVAYSCTTREDNVQYTVFCRNSSTFDSALYCIYCSLTCQTEQAYSRYEANSHGPENAPKYFETQKYLFFLERGTAPPQTPHQWGGGHKWGGVCPPPHTCPRILSAHSAPLFLRLRRSTWQLLDPRPSFNNLAKVYLRS